MSAIPPRSRFADLAPLPVETIDLGGIRYADAYDLQVRYRDELVKQRQVEGAGHHPSSTTQITQKLLLLEHVPPVITVGRRPGARAHLVASPEWLQHLGIEVCETDRGGDITYHGPGQLVGYPIVDLNRLNLGLHGYMRLLEAVIIRVLDRLGIAGRRDVAAVAGEEMAGDIGERHQSASSATQPGSTGSAIAVGGATGVWVDLRHPGPELAPLLPPDAPASLSLAKICALGVRVSRWVTMHGFALNVTTNLDHFAAIVPCGLAGRPVTSIERLLTSKATGRLATPVPTMDSVKATVAEVFDDAVASPRACLERGAAVEERNIAAAAAACTERG